MDLGAETEAYQVYLEAVRAHPDDQELWEDLGKAKDALEVAYLEHLAAWEAKPVTAEDVLRPELRAADLDPTDNQPDS